MRAFARAADELERRQEERAGRYPWQIPPQIPIAGRWLCEGGRGAGKTQAIAQYVVDHVNGPPCDTRIPGGHRIAIVAPTMDDAAESMVTGPSGIQQFEPRARLVTKIGGSKVVFPSGAEAKLFSGATKKEVDRLRSGGNRCLVVIEEAAAIPHLGSVKAHAQFGLRIGPHPHMVAASTPRPRPDYIEFRNSAIITHGSTRDAHNLPREVVDQWYAEYGGTSLGRQELDGVLLDTAPGALWDLGVIDDHRKDDPPGILFRQVIAVDPATTSGPGADETGIVVAGLNKRWSDGGHGYVLADLSGRFTPGEAWRVIMLEASRRLVDAVVYETNQGGEYITRAAEDAWNDLAKEGQVDGPVPRLRPVHARRGKVIRAEPIAAQYEQKRWHHVGMFTQLEDQLAQWEPGTKWRHHGPPGADERESDSPDRLDALVYAAIELTGAVGPTTLTVPGSVRRRAPASVTYQRRTRLGR